MAPFQPSSSYCGNSSGWILGLTAPTTAASFSPSATESTPSIRASSPASAYGEYAAMAPVSPKAAEIWAAAVLLRWDSPLNGGTSRAKSAATRSGEPAACRSPSSAVNRSNSSSTVGSPR